MSPVFSLGNELIFPHPVLHEPDGLLAVGGSLSPERLLLAYRWGIYPWYHDDLPILWWWTSPRMMIATDKIHISRSLKRFLNKGKYQVTFDRDFDGVIRRCSTIPRRGQEGTWILPEMIDAYTELHRLGYAHSIEVYEHEVLIGGIYGIALGKIFFGESMFSERVNASKVGLVYLCEHLRSKGMEWLDCQQETPHLRSMGGEFVGEEDFLRILRENQLLMLKSSELNF